MQDKYMTTFEKYSLLVNSIFAFLLLSQLIVALWGERLHQIWSKPKLKVEFEEPTLTSQTDGKKGWYYYLRISNSKKSFPANNVRVLLYKVFKKDPDHLWHERKFSGPVQVMWRSPKKMPEYTRIGPDEHSTFACLWEGSLALRLQLIEFPSDLDINIGPNEPTRLEFKAVSDTAESDTLTLEITWDGQWVGDRTAMSNHIIVRKVNR
jgi:hypothetical protein